MMTKFDDIKKEKYQYKRREKEVKQDQCSSPLKDKIKRCDYKFFSNVKSSQTNGSQIYYHKIKPRTTLTSVNSSPSKHKLISCGSQESFKESKLESFGCCIKSKYGRCSCETPFHNKLNDFDQSFKDFSFSIVPKLMKSSSIPQFNYSDQLSSRKI